MTYSLNCGHRQDIVKFPHRIQNHLHVNFLMGHRRPFDAVFFNVHAASPLFLQKLHVPSEQRFWNLVLDSHQLFLNCRQRQKTKL